MISRIVLLAVFLSGRFLALAQNDPYDRTLVGYSSYLYTNYGITTEFSDAFTDLNQYFVIMPIKEYDAGFSGPQSGFIYGPMFQSEDKECVIMYPALMMYVSKEDIELGKKMAKLNRQLKGDTSPIPSPHPSPNDPLSRNHVISEIKAAIGMQDSDSVSFDFNEHVTIIAGKQVRDMFNADSVYIYDLKVERPYHGKYTYRTGVVISKKNRATMVLKLFFTPEGKKNEEEYLRALSKRIWYEEGFSHEE